MLSFTFQNILLRQFSDGTGWEIIGVRHNHTEQLLLTLVRGCELALSDDLVNELVSKLANGYAQQLAGKPSAEVN